MFVRAYSFLSSILPYNNRGWKEHLVFLDFLIPKCPSPAEDDLSKGILEMIDMDSYRVEKRAMQKIILEDEDGEIDRVRTRGGERTRSRSTTSDEPQSDSAVRGLCHTLPRSS